MPKSPARRTETRAGGLLAAREVSALRRRLLAWYQRAHRDLPWRRTQDPYRIWVSEIMLQQTRVEAVIPYYQSFLRQFPTVAALARAPEERVMAAWSGLGYYARARNLQRAAQVVLAQHGGEFPRGEAAALRLPGVGRYTAAAVLSIAYETPLAALDGNVARVLSRLLTLPADVRETNGRRLLQEAAGQLLHPRRPGEFNQGMMELGAMVCVPAAPRCGQCPLAELCRAHRQGMESGFPPMRRRTDERALKLVGALVRDAAGRILLERRDSEAAWMGGFWELPTWESRAAKPGAPTHRSQLREVLRLGRVLGRVRHSITRFRIVAEVREAALLDNGGAALETARLRWVPVSELGGLPVSTITRKALRLGRAAKAGK